MLDAWGKPGSRLFQYSPKFYGDYDNCIRSVPEANFTSQYCTASVTLEQLAGMPLPDKPRIRYKAGLCLPSTCNEDSASAAVNDLVKLLPSTNMTYESISCVPRSLPLTDKAVVVIVVLSLFAVCIVLGTVYDVMVVKGYFLELTCQRGQDGGSGGQGEKEPLIGGESKQVTSQGHQPGWVGKFFLSFSVRTNAAKLLSVKSAPGTITCITGIRFYSMAWVVLGHYMV